MRIHSHSVADNTVVQNFNPKHANQIWAGEVTYLRTGQGWMYLVIVMDLYYRRIIGWAIHKRMTVDLVKRAMQMALNLRKHTKDLIFHSDRGSQDVDAYIRYYSQIRLQTSNGDCSPIKFEQSTINVSYE